MDTYDPQDAPNPTEWLALDEQERIGLALRAHTGRFPDALHTADANPMMHGSLHAIVETQVASKSPAITGQTLDRLAAAGLKRHAATHAVMQVLASHIAKLGDGTPFDHEGYARDVGRLDASGIVANALVRPPDVVNPGPNRAERRKAAKERKKARGRNRSKSDG